MLRIKDLSHERIWKLRNAAARYAGSRGTTQDIQDFASYVSQRAIEKPGTSFKMALLWVQFRREYYGRDNPQFCTEIDKKHPCEERRNFTDIPGIAKQFGIVGIERSVFLLWFQFDAEFEEIALILDISSGEAKQKLSDVMEKLKGKL